MMNDYKSLNIRLFTTANDKSVTLSTSHETIRFQIDLNSNWQGKLLLNDLIWPSTGHQKWPQWCRWQCDDSSLIMVTIFRCRWISWGLFKMQYPGCCNPVILKIGHQHLKLVLNINNFQHPSPTLNMQTYWMVHIDSSF